MSWLPFLGFINLKEKKGCFSVFITVGPSFSLLESSVHEFDHLRLGQILL